jgi:uncharacterized membrane protein YjfL (UPF0719 family)
MDPIELLGHQGLVLVAAALTALVLLVAYRLTARFAWREGGAGSAATRLVHAGETLGLFIISGSVARGCIHGEELLSELGWTAIFGICGAVLLAATGRLGTSALLGASQKQEISRGNAAAGLACAGHYVATSIIIAHCLYGNDLRTLGVSIAFFVIGQVTLHGFIVLFRALTSYDDAEEIRGENMAAALSYAGAAVALAMIIAHAAEGEFVGWSASLKAYGAALVVAFALWPVRQLVVQTIIVGARPTLWRGKLDDGIARERNTGLGALEAVTYLATALVVTWLM